MSRRQKDRNGALIGEKSQAVYSANWKLDTILGKQLSMLDTSKRRVSHSIAIDQTIVNKRFQLKLYQSKVYNARMTGNRELLRQLTHRDKFSFNTSVGQDDQYTVNFKRNSVSAPAVECRSKPNHLKSETENKVVKADEVIQSTVSTMNKVNALRAFQRKISPRTLSLVHKKRVDDDLQIKQPTPVADDNEDVLNHQNSSVVKPVDSSETDYISKSASSSTKPTSAQPVISFDIPTPSSTDLTNFSKDRRRRPITATARFSQKMKPSEHSILNTVVEVNGPKPLSEQIDRRPKSSTIPDQINKTTNSELLKTDISPLKIEAPARSVNDSINLSEYRAANDNQHSGSKPKIMSMEDEKNVVPAPKVSLTLQESSIKHLERPENMDHTDSKTDAVLQTKRKSIFMNSKNKQVIPSIFGEQRKPTIFDINKERLENANFPSRFDNFFERIKGLENENDYCADYYTMRLQQTCNQTLFRPDRVNETEEKQYSIRSVGNLAAKNLTFQDLNHDFSDYPSQYYLNPRPSSVTRNNSYSVKNAWDINDK